MTHYEMLIKILDETFPNVGWGLRHDHSGTIGVRVEDIDNYSESDHEGGIAEFLFAPDGKLISF